MSIWSKFCFNIQELWVMMGIVILLFIIIEVIVQSLLQMTDFLLGWNKKVCLKTNITQFLKTQNF